MANAILLNNVDADVEGTVFYTSNGGKVRFVIRASDYGGGTVTLQLRAANDTGAKWGDMENGEFTEDGDRTADFLPVGDEVRAVLSGATAPSNVYVGADQ